MKLLDGKVAVVTGAARGIGLACARQLSQAGAAVVLIDVLGDQVEAAAEELRATGAAAGAISADVSRVENLASLVGAAQVLFGRIDILVNNAGISPEAPTPALTEAQWDRVMQVNLKAVFFVTQATLPIMLRQG